VVCDVVGETSIFFRHFKPGFNCAFRTVAGFDKTCRLTQPGIAIDFVISEVNQATDRPQQSHRSHGFHELA